MVKYPAGTVVRMVGNPDDWIRLLAIGGQRGTPVVRPESTCVVVIDSPALVDDVPFVVLGLRSGWAGATDDQIEVVRDRRPLAVSASWSLTPPDGGPWEPYAYLVSGADGWDLRWIPKGCDDPGELEDDGGFTIPWPFGSDDIAEPADFERIGFRVET